MRNGNASPLDRRLQHDEALPAKSLVEAEEREAARKARKPNRKTTSNRAAAVGMIP
jgi:hypothetical protein